MPMLYVPVINFLVLSGHFTVFLVTFLVWHFFAEEERILLERPGPEVIKLFSCSTQLSITFIEIINVKMPTMVGILTIISMINTTSESLKARKVCIFSILDFIRS